MKRYLFLFLLFTTSFASFPHPIDIVYTWVDGSDPEWKEIKDTYLLHEKENIKVLNSYSENRYGNHDELKFSLRSVYQYAPFVNHIYIVTMNQIPEWLESHPKITVIDHTEIFTDLSDLPTFNSQAIECHLHRIPNLSDHYLYLNDDVFFGAPVRPEDFFTDNGCLKVSFSKAFTPSGKSIFNDTAHQKAWRNTNALLDRFYKRERRRFLSHAPFPLIKSYVEKSEKAFPDVFTVTSKSRFRSSEDYNVTCGFLHYLWKYEGNVEESRISNLKVSISENETNALKFLKLIKDKKPQTFCIQDMMKTCNDQNNTVLHIFFQKLFPKPAPWEKENL